MAKFFGAELQCPQAEGLTGNVKKKRQNSTEPRLARLAGCLAAEQQRKKKKKRIFYKCWFFSKSLYCQEKTAGGEQHLGHMIRFCCC